MKHYFTSLLLFLSVLLLNPFFAYADNYQTSVNCAYSHTLGDDAILMFGMPGRAMWHDFFGNQKTDAYSTYVTLREAAGTTCDTLADSSAYWSPAMRLPNQQIAPPKYTKVYYQTVNSTQYPLTSLPEGLQLLAGNHTGTTENPYISFFCNDGSGYSNTDQRTCQRASDGTLQVDIGIRFPNCWDGHTLKAKPSGSPTKPNAVYSNDDGSCPVDYPKHIPTINMNVAYIINGYDKLDLTQVQLSLDPIMNGDQRIDQWGTMYTAHGDFVNGWSPDAAKFMTERCMNNNYDCTGTMPYSYNDPIADTYVSNLADSDKNFGSQPQMLVLGDISNNSALSNPMKIALVKYKIPAMPTQYPADQAARFTYRLRLSGHILTTPANAITMYAYPATTDWDESSVTWNNRPTCDVTSWSSLYLDTAVSYREFDVTKLVQKALQKGQTEIAFCIAGDSKTSGYTYSFSTKETPYLSQLRVVATQPGGA
uniref:CBM96 family carbohydrate-binding protein n=1 Tax=Hafnia alvei TaxID=569 RepID=UPI0026EC6085|nr:DUF1996 domain-containing protein [Hafnia alvei]